MFKIRLVARLLDKQLRLTCYSHDRRFDDEARASWVEPDLQDCDVDDL
jgi:hypothetical protein